MQSFGSTGAVGTGNATFPFANFERYFDNTSMQHYIATASEPKKVIRYDSGHELNDPQALRDRYAWLAKEIGIKANLTP